MKVTVLIPNHHRYGETGVLIIVEEDHIEVLFEDGETVWIGNSEGNISIQ